AVVQAAPRLLGDRADDRRVIVAEDPGAVAAPAGEIDVAVHVPLAGAVRALDVEGEGRDRAAVVGDAARHAPEGALVERLRLRAGRRVFLLERRGRGHVAAGALGRAVPSIPAARGPLEARRQRASATTPRPRRSAHAAGQPWTSAPWLAKIPTTTRRMPTSPCVDRCSPRNATASGATRTGATPRATG